MAGNSDPERFGDYLVRPDGAQARPVRLRSKLALARRRQRRAAANKSKYRNARTTQRKRADFWRINQDTSGKAASALVFAPED